MGSHLRPPSQPDSSRLTSPYPKDDLGWCCKSVAHPTRAADAPGAAMATTMSDRSPPSQPNGLGRGLGNDHGVAECRVRSERPAAQRSLLELVGLAVVVLRARVVRTERKRAVSPGSVLHVPLVHPERTAEA